MKTIQLQITLLVAAAVYLGWGLGLLLAPEAVYPWLSSGPYDRVVASLFGVSLLGFMVTFLIAARDPVKEIVRAAAAAMALIGFTAAYLMFGSKHMPFNLVTGLSLVVDVAAAGILFLTEAKLDLERHSGKPATARR